MRRTESYLLSLITDTSAPHKPGQGAEARGPAGEQVARRGENKIPGKVSEKPWEGKRGRVTGDGIGAKRLEG